MPTKRARYVITETEEIAAAIDVARRRLPTASRADALRYLVRVGAEEIDREVEGHANRVRRNAGRFAGMYPAGYLGDLRSEWPQ